MKIFSKLWSGKTISKTVNNYLHIPKLLNFRKNVVLNKEKSINNQKKTMIDVLYQLDVSILHFLNQTISNPIFDKFFIFITDVKNWYLTYLVLFLILIFKGGRIGRLSAVFMLVLIVTSDQFSSHFLKNLFERLRPCNVLPDVRTLIGCSGTFSFPSSHAVNNFAAATFFAVIFPKYKWILFVSAFLVAISRPYLGLHYPSDTLGGAIIGILLGYLFALLVLKVDEKFPTRKTKISED